MTLVIWSVFELTPVLQNLQTEGKKGVDTLVLFVLVLTLLTSCRGVRSLHAVPLWPADGRVGRNVGRQRASMATPDRT